MLTPIELLCSAIATKEGFYAPGNTPPARNHNPGDLRASPLARAKSGGGFVVFNSNVEGIAGLYHQVLLDALRGMTARQCISAWAPPDAPDGGNDTAKYIADVQKWTGLDMDVPLWTFLPLQNMYLYKKEI